MTETTAFTGRGAWTSTGTGSGVTDYELAVPYVGLLWATAHKGDANSRAVNSGVKAIQAAVNVELTVTHKTLLTVDGVFGPLTKAGVMLLQHSLGVTTDGQFGPASARALWGRRAVAVGTAHGIPANYLAGLIAEESAFDPGAVGVETTYGIDRGLAQLNAAQHPEIIWAQAFDPLFAIPYAAATLAGVYQSLKNWEATIAYWNSPEKALEWAQTGRAPDSEIELYVASVQQKAATFS